MRLVYDNIIFKLQENRPAGISAYWRQLIDRLVKSDVELRLFGEPTKNIFDAKEWSQEHESSINYKIRRYLPFLDRLPDGSIFHSSYYRVSLQKNIKNVVTVHDFTHEYYRSGMAKMVHHWQKGFAIKNADAIICISENTKKDLIKFFPKTDPNKLHVIYHGVSDSYFPAYQDAPDKFKDLGKYVLFVGGRGGYKNFDKVVSALSATSGYRLVIAGGGQLSDEEKNKLDLDLGDRYSIFPIVDEADLNFLYGGAFAFVYPSAYEGFGMPILEAMRAGCPVIASNNSSIPEVAGDAATLLEKPAPELINSALKKLENKNFRGDLIRRGLEQSQNFSWDKCFRQTNSLYMELSS